MTGGVWGELAAGYRPVAHWPHVPGRAAAEEVVVRLLLRGAVHDLFVFDTGAQWTVVTPALARLLKLRREEEAPAVCHADGSVASYYRSEIGINIGATWRGVPCLIPANPRGPGCARNLFGMKGVLDAHLFCVTRNAVRVFRQLT